jgi:hypothetical protein
MKKIVLLFLVVAGSAQLSFAQCSEKVMEAFGGTSSLALYNTYITIGAVADGYVAETYDSQRVQSLMDEQTAMIAIVIQFIDGAVAERSETLSEADRVYLVEMKDCLLYLKKEAQGLHDIAAYGTDEANSAYDTNRDLAWDAISELLGLND